MGPERTRAKHSAEKSERKQGSFEIALPIRLAISSVLVIISALFKMPVLFRTILLILAVIVSGYDVFLAAVDSIAEKRYLATPVVVLFAAVLSFVIGFTFEGALMVLFHQLSGLLIDYTRRRALRSARSLAVNLDEDGVTRLEEILADDRAGEMQIHQTLQGSAEFVLRFVLVFSLIYAFLFPFITGISFRVSIHRALMILLIASPLSVAVSFPVVAVTALCHGAQNGILFNNAAVMEKLTGVNVALFDKPGVFSEETPHVIGLQSDLLDKKTFLNFLAHAVYYSDQPFAKAIADYYNQEYRLDLINHFNEIPGCGVSLEIGQAPVVLATKSYYDSQGVDVPERGMAEGIAYYMTVAGRYVGRVVISSDINRDAEALVREMNEAGVSRCILLTEDGNEQSQVIADALHFSEVFGECDMDRKLRLIRDVSQTGQNSTVFIYANGIEGHSAANLDMRISRKGKYADILVLPENYLNIPKAVQISKRAKELITENAVFVFIIKALLMFLSIIGYSNLWFVVFMDTVAALATMLNAIRITTPSVFQKQSGNTDR